MAGTTTVSKAVFVAESQGVEQTAAALTKLGGAAKGAGTAAQQAQKALLGKEGSKAFAASVDQSTRAMAQMERQANRLQSSLDPVHRATVQLATVEAQVAKLVDARTISVARGNELLVAAAEKYGKFGKSAKEANDNIKLGAGQVQNLSFQLNDAVTMLAMGASPFQIMASQGGQVVQALGDHPGGVTGSLKAMGAGILALATPTNLAIAGLTAAAGAALYFGTRADSSVKTAAESLERYKRLLDDLGVGYKSAIR